MRLSCCLVLYLIYHPMSSLLNLTKITLSSGFLKMWANWSLVSIGKIWIDPSATKYLKWWYLIVIYFVLGVNLGLSTTLLQLRFYLKTLQWNLRIGLCSVKTSPTSIMRFIKGIISCIACDSAIYSDSVVLRAISVLRFPHHVRGHPEYIITSPIRERTPSGFS